MSFVPLSGNLRKLGEKGIKKTWKKRFFRQNQESPTRIYYYLSERASSEKGYINLEAAIGVLRTSDSSFNKTFCFQVNTPKRIYYLQAESESDVNYWIEGISKILKDLNTSQPSDSQMELELEHANNRITDLEIEAARYRKALHLTSSALGISPAQVLQYVEQGLSALPADVLQNNEQPNNQQPAPESAKTVSNDNPNDAPPPSSFYVNSEQQLPKAVEYENQSSNTITVEYENQPTSTSKQENQPIRYENQPASSSSTVEYENLDKEEKKQENPADCDSVLLSTFPAIVLYEYNARKPYELSLIPEETITVISKHENGWWLGYNQHNNQGYFPASYVSPTNEEDA